MKKEEYLKYVEKNMPRAKLLKTLPLSFLIGGLICALAEVFRQFLLNALELQEKYASAISSAILIFLTAILTGFGIFHKIAKFAGAGTFVPITGFANSVVAPALEFKTEGFVLGVAAKMFVIAGPVIVYGVSSSIIYGAILYFISFLGG